MFLLLTVVVTKHVWPYFQSRFPKTSSERVSSRSTRGYKKTFPVEVDKLNMCCVSHKKRIIVHEARSTSELFVPYRERLLCQEEEEKKMKRWEIKDINNHHSSDGRA
jgi:hypothetical protein